MLYRFTPFGRVDWNDLPRNLASVVVENGKSLDDLTDWINAERVLDDTMLRLALRYGHTSRQGLIVDARHLVPYDAIRRIAETHRDVIAHRPEYRKTLEVLESVMPGTLAAEDESNRAADKSTMRTLAERQRSLDAALEQEPQQRLAAHWEGLGGSLPDPL